MNKNNNRATVGVAQSDKGKNASQVIENKLLKQVKRFNLMADKEKQRVQLEGLLAESGAKDRELDILRKRLLFDTNELNTLSQKVEQMAAAQQTKDKYNDSDEDIEDDNKRQLELRRKNGDAGIMANLKIVKLTEQIQGCFQDLINMQTGQLLDEIKGNAHILSGISKIKHVVQAICVKFVRVNPLIQMNSGKDGVLGGSLLPENPFLCTFRIYPTTKFSEIKMAACDFWSKNQQKFILTDEYYNNLSSYTEPVTSFFKAYTPINSQGEAVVYLVEAYSKASEIHKLQLESVALDDKKGGAKGGKDKERGDGFLGKLNKKTLDLQKIEKALPGLEMYKSPNETQLKKYLERSDPTAFFNNIWIFIITTIILTLTIISLELKESPKSVYVITKSIESMFESQGLVEAFNEQFDQQGDIFKQAVIDTKNEHFMFI